MKSIIGSQPRGTSTNQRHGKVQFSISICFILIAIVLTGCAHLASSKKKDTKKDTTTRQLRYLSSKGICLVYSVWMRDSDGDGYSDFDEIVAGTDPRDPHSTPSMLEIAVAIGKDRLPSFNMGWSEIVVLPTKTPGGGDLMPTGWMPARKDTLAALGINSDLLSHFGLSTDTGFRFQVDRPGVHDGAPAWGGRRVSGIEVGLISAGRAMREALASAIINDKTDLVPLGYNAPDLVKIVCIEKGSGTTEAGGVFSDGTVFHVQVDKNGDTKEWTTDKNGKQIGAKVETEHSQKSNADGSVTYNTLVVSTAPDGTAVWHDYNTTEHENADGSKTKLQTSQTTNVDKDKNTTVEPQKKETDNIDKDGNTTATTKETCDKEGNNCTTTGTYSNPDYDEGTTILPSAEEMARIVKERKGGNTTPGPVQEGPVIGGPLPITYFGAGSPLVVDYEEQKGASPPVIYTIARPDLVQPEQASPWLPPLPRP